jgi:hypothetical protein
MNCACALCGQPVDPTSNTTFQRVIGWQRKAMSASRKSGSDIVMRERLDEWPTVIALSSPAAVSRFPGVAAVTDREELLYRIARALDHSREASEMQEAADQAHATPDNAAQLHWDAAGLLEGVLVRVKAMHDQHVFGRSGWSARPAQSN